MKYFFLLSAKNTKTLGHKLVLIEPAQTQFYFFQNQEYVCRLVVAQCESYKSDHWLGNMVVNEIISPYHKLYYSIYCVVRIVYTLQYILLF